MAQPEHKMDKQAVAWLQHVLTELETDPDIEREKPIEEIRAELREMGADTEGFHRKLAHTLRMAQIKQVGEAFIKWLSPIWQPQWAGQFVGAGDVPTQTHAFPIPGGHIEVVCSWKPQAGETPSYLDISWKANIVMEGELWCQFVQSDTHEVLCQCPLGTYNEGGKYFSSQTLGFEPDKERWALSILIKEPSA